MQTKNKPFYLKLFAIMVVTEFILLFAVLLIQGLIISKESSNIVYKSNIEKLDIIKDYAEMLLGDIETIAFNTVFDDNISVVDGIKSSDSINVNKTFELYSLIDFLKKRVVVDSRIDSVYLYHYNSDIIVTSEGDICFFDEFPDNSWKSYYQEDRRLQWTGKRIIRRGIAENAVITLIYPYRSMDSLTDYALVVNVSLRELNDAILNSKNEDSSEFCIINSEGETILKQADENFSVETAASVIEGSSVNKDGMLYSCIVSDYNGWKYVNASSLDVIGGKYRNIVTSILLALMIMFVLGVFINWIISKQLARPVELLVKKINLDKNLGDFDIINEAIDEMLQREDYMHQLLSSGNVKEAYLKECLISNIYTPDPQIIYTCAECIGYVIVTASVSGFAGFSAKFSEEEFKNIITVVKVMGEKAFDEIGEVISVYVASNVWTWLVKINGREVDTIKAANLLRDSIEEISGENAVVVMNGEEFELFRDMRDVYNMCIRHRTEQIMYSRSCVVLCETEIDNDNGFEYPQDLEKRIINSIDINDREQYIEVASVFFSYIRKVQPLSDIVYMIVNRLLGTMMMHIVSSMGGIPEDFENNLYAELMSLETLDEIELFIYSTGVRMITYQRENIDNNKHITDMLAFIRGNYQKDIGIHDIAQSVGLSYSHVRRIFSEEMNTSILAYLNDIRINEAKKYLSQTNMAIKEISTKVGYNNEQSFNRYFKKSTGITPGDWRRRKLSESKED